MGTVGLARSTRATRHSRSAGVKGRSKPTTVVLGGVVAVCLAVVTACTGEQQPPGPSPRIAEARPLVAEFVDDAEAIEPAFEVWGDETPVSVAGRRFQARCVGTGEPAVILVSGGDTPQTTWSRVHAKVGAKTRICSYDRLGVGESGPRPPVQTLAELAADLDGVIDALGLSRPLVVVGHSLGGAIAMVWATTHQADAAGVVLVDATSAAAEREFAKQAREHYPAEAELQADPEQVDMSTGAAQLDALPSLGAVPLVVLTHTLNRPDPYHPDLDWDAVERAWVDGQRHWATYSRVSELVSVPDAGHVIHDDQLDVVVAAVLRML